MPGTTFTTRLPVNAALFALAPPRTGIIIWYTVYGYQPDDVALRRQAEPWYDAKTEPSFEDMLTKLRKTLVDQLDVVMVLGPVITHTYHPYPPLRTITCRSAEETSAI